MFAQPTPQPPDPLADVSNGSVYHSTIPSDDQKRKSSIRGICRSQSFRCLPSSASLSDTFSSEPDSIYDAEVVDSVQDLVPFENQLFPVISDFNAWSAIAEEKGVGSGTPAGQSHSRWPQQTLDPIMERNSTMSLRRSSSSPCLVGPGDEYLSRAIRSGTIQHSLRSVRRRSDPVGMSQLLSHGRLFSAYALDCLPKSDVREAYAPTRILSSSTSTEVLKGIKGRPASPMRPMASPPLVPSTPPGLPSFGTQEAQELRLNTESYYDRAAALLNRVLRYATMRSDEKVPGRSARLNPTSKSLPELSLSPPMDMLRHVLRSSKMVESRGLKNVQRVGLPPSVTVATTLGPLIQSEDGTFVRGRWGNRASAHGVSGRHLRAHPLLRAAGISSTEMIQQDDKDDHQHEQPHQDAGIGNTAIGSRTTNDRPLETHLASTLRTQPEVGAQAVCLVTRHSHDSGMSNQSPVLLPDSSPVYDLFSASPWTSSPILSPELPTRMPEPQQYPPQIRNLPPAQVPISADNSDDDRDSWISSCLASCCSKCWRRPRMSHHVRKDRDLGSATSMP